jgi:hypothetical protein
LAAFYVARNEAQRAADAAALAGAKVFVETSCISLGTCSNFQVQATQRAKTVGAQNTVFGQAANIQNSDVTFPPAPPQDPLITVTVQRTTARGNAVPTFFAKILGKSTVDISAVATAEAYNPSGTSNPPTFCTGCIRPWFVPNCDPNSISPANSKCAPASNGNKTPAYFVDPNNRNAIANNKCAPQGPIGEYFPIKVNTVPSQYGAVDFGGGANGYRTDIEICNTGQFKCGNTFSVKTGNMVGPTKQGVETLLNMSGTGVNGQQGQDTIDTTVCPPQIKAGSRNPLVLNNVVPTGATMSSSSSVVTVIVYDGTQLSPGKGFNKAIPIVGFMQVFLTGDSDGSPGQLCGNTQMANSDVCGVVLNIVGCGITGGNCSAGTGTVSGGGGSLIPIRLVRNPGS